MLEPWERRSVITANLLNPAFCGEVLRSAIMGYNTGDGTPPMPFSLVFLILPFVLHKRTREAMPRNTKTYFHSWIESNEHLFIDFPERTKQLLPYSKEAILFLSKHDVISLTENGVVSIIKRRTVNRDEKANEINDTYKKSELLGKWFKQTGNEQTIYMFLKIQP